MTAVDNLGSASRVRLVLAALLLVGLVVTAACPGEAGPLFGGRSKREGDILHIFERATVYVVTNDDATLADTLLEGCQHKQRRVLSLDEWRRLPEGALWYVSTVFLINRERLSPWQRVPDKCLAEGDEVWLQAARAGRSWGISHEVIISAPDAAWLSKAVAEFRSLKELPRNPLKHNVRSLAVVPVGIQATQAAQPFLTAKEAPLAHLVSLDRYQAATARLAVMDEVLLIDRSTVDAGTPSFITALLQKRAAHPNQTMVWRESKEKGRTRVVFSAPNGDLLAQAVRSHPNLSAVPETPTVSASARDLRQVRRVAVAGVRNGAGGATLARRVASVAAMQVRALDAFEVLERAGLSEVLGEIALDQAGITKANDRARVRQLAAADALLIVELTSAEGRTDYVASHERLTPRMGKAPPKPLEPSRLRVLPTLPGKENDRMIVAATEVLLRRVVGVKNEEEYKDALDRYNCETLPRWQQQVDEHHARYRTRPIAWRQNILAKSAVTVSGSLRLVDLVDGLVLWETPFSVTEHDESLQDTRNVATVGEDSSPDAAPRPASSSQAPEAVVLRAAEVALAQGINALRATALLPPHTNTIQTALGPATLVAAPDATAPSSRLGRILDVDGDTLLVGLGATDGLRLGDTLAVTLGNDRKVRAIVTRVRPRTCDAAFDKEAPGDLRTLVAIGQQAVLEAGR